MQTLSNQASWKPWKAILYYIGLFLILLFPYSLLITYLGIPGLILGQLVFLAYALTVTKLHKTPLKEVFPIHKIKIIDIVGVIILAIGCILLDLLFAGIGMVLFPSDYSNVAESTAILTQSGLPPLLIAFIIAATPAICEESIMRGGLLSYFRGFKSELLACVLVGIGFGILHTSAIKFLPTAFMGAMMAYIMVKRNNILLPSLLHFFNNFIVTLISSLSAGSESVSADNTAAAMNALNANPMSLIGAFVFIAFLAPVLIMLGMQLLKAVKPTAPKWVIAAILSVTMFFGGLVMIVFSSLGQGLITQFSGSQTLGDDYVPYEFTIDEDGTYNIILTGDLTGEGADIVVVNENEDTVSEKEFGAGMYLFNETVELEEGEYTIVFTPTDTEQTTDMTVNGEVLKK